jgi:hypothetical protein
MLSLVSLRTSACVAPQRTEGRHEVFAAVHVCIPACRLRPLRRRRTQAGRVAFGRRAAYHGAAGDALAGYRRFVATLLPARADGRPFLHAAPGCKRPPAEHRKRHGHEILRTHPARHGPERGALRPRAGGRQRLFPRARRTRVGMALLRRLEQLARFSSLRRHPGRRALDHELALRWVPADSMAVASAGARGTCRRAELVAQQGRTR